MQLNGAAMKSIVVASTNPVKILAALEGFKGMFPQDQFAATGVSVPSGVSDQPMSGEETLTGAMNRACAARDQHPGDYWIGIEGGLEIVNGEMECFAWIVVLSKERTGKSRTATFFLPQEISALVQQGLELGDADDRVFGLSNSKQQNGSIGILTEDVITRTSYYEHAVMMALVPFKNPKLTFGQAE
jgi:inosine/xanthosine triphosphatase